MHIYTVIYMHNIYTYNTHEIYPYRSVLHIDGTL